MKNSAIILVFSAFMIGTSSIVFAQAPAAQNFTAETVFGESAGMLPDSFFYPFKRFGESVQLFFTFDSLEKAKLKYGFAQLRLIEADAMAGLNKTRLAEDALKDYENDISEVEADEKTISNAGRNTSAIADLVGNNTYKHILVLQNVYDKVPDSAKPAIMDVLEKSMERQQKIAERIAGNNTVNITIIVGNVTITRQVPAGFAEKFLKHGGRVFIFPPVPIPTRHDENIIEKRNETAKKEEGKESKICAQVITSAISPSGDCKEFPTSCIPEGWKKTEKCPAIALLYPNNTDNATASVLPVPARVSIGNVSASFNGTAATAITLTGMNDFGAVAIDIYYNKTVVNVSGAALGFSLFGGSLVPNINNTNGKARFVIITTAIPGPNSPLTLVNISLQATGLAGESGSLRLVVTTLAHTNGTSAVSTAQNGTFSIT